MKWDGTMELGYLGECERQNHFMPLLSTQSLAEGHQGRTKLIGNYKDIGQDPEFADGRDDYFAVRVLGRKTWIDWYRSN